MGQYVVNRPDEEAMERALEKAAFTAAGAVLRLAWQAGLTREEIVTLTWRQVDIPGRSLSLPERTVPLTEELARWLETLRQRREGERVVLSDRDNAPLTPQSVSRLARRALDGEGQSAVRLADLRNDFILRQLEAHGWQYASRVSGVEAAGLRAHFGEAFPPEDTEQAPPPMDEFALWQLLQREGSTPVGVTLWLTWRHGLHLGEIAALRWEQVDLENGLLRLPERTVVLGSGTVSALCKLHAASPAGVYVLTAPGGGAFDRTRLSRLVRSALVRAGLDGVTPRDLRLDWQTRQEGEEQVTAYLRRSRSITRDEAAALLGVSPEAAYGRLRRMARRGKLTQVGTRYYLPGSVVPTQRQEQVVLEYLRQEGFAYRQDIARLLHLPPSQCRPILKRLLAAGKLLQDGQRYLLRGEA